MKRILSIAFCLGLGFASYGQSLERQVIGSAGSFMTNSSGSISFTVGELMVAYHTNSNGSLSEGFQQTASEESVSVLEVNKEGVQASVYPNPTDGILQLKSNLESIGVANLEYYVMDMQGRVVLNGATASNGGKINVSILSKSVYTIVLKSKTGQFQQRIRFTKI